MADWKIFFVNQFCTIHAIARLWKLHNLSHSTYYPFFYHYATNSFNGKNISYFCATAQLAAFNEIWMLHQHLTAKKLLCSDRKDFQPDTTWCICYFIFIAKKVQRLMYLLIDFFSIAPMLLIDLLYTWRCDFNFSHN